MTTDPTSLIHGYATNLKQQLDEFERATVRCGLIGSSGTGKSSLINAIVGEKVAAVGSVETTNEAQEVRHNGLIFVDLPGCGTQKWPRETYISRLNPLTYDCFLLVTADRFREDDIFLYHELTKLGRACFLLRNKIDLAIRDELHDNNRSEDEVKQTIRTDIRRQLDLAPDHPIYLTSARQPTEHDFPHLLHDIQSQMSELKQDRLIADMAAYNRDALKKKRELATKRVRIYAGLAAANGLNPIIGLDVAADIAFLLKMSKEVAGIYGLTNVQSEYWRRFLQPESAAKLVAKVALFAGKYMAKQGIVTMIKTMSKRIASKEISKFIPFAGPLVAAGVGWKATFLLGEQLVDEAEALAEEVLQNILDDTQLEISGPSWRQSPESRR